jgi:hypothetical protein
VVMAKSGTTHGPRAGSGPFDVGHCRISGSWDILDTVRALPPRAVGRTLMGADNPLWLRVKISLVDEVDKADLREERV